MLLLPSEIHFSYDMSMSDVNSEVQIYKTQRAKDGLMPPLPKLQVFMKDGCYFALDNNCLKLYRQLEQCGHCGYIHVEVVPRNHIPKKVFQQTLCTEKELSFSTSGSESSDHDEESDEGEDVVCKVCGRSFTGIRELTEHLNSKKHFGCSTCSKVFSSSSNLQQHKKDCSHWTDDEDGAAVGHSK